MGLNVAGQRKINIICSLLTLKVSPCSFPPMILKPKASFAWDLVRTRLWICFTISHAISLVVISVGRALLIRQEDGMSERVSGRGECMRGEEERGRDGDETAMELESGILKARRTPCPRPARPRTQRPHADAPRRRARITCPSSGSGPAPTKAALFPLSVDAIFPSRRRTTRTPHRPVRNKVSRHLKTSHCKNL